MEARRLYRHGVFEPIAQPGDKIMLLGADGPFGDNPFWEVQFVEPVKGLGPHGVVLLWSQSATPPAGYTLPAGAATGSINAGASSNVSQPATFNMGVGELLQMRWRIAPLALTGPALDDIDITVNLPPAVSRNGTLGQQGRWNMIEQDSSPSDTQVEPAQGANKAIPADYPALAQAAWSNLSELYIWEQTFVPAFTIINNGSSNLTAGAIGLRVSGFRYQLRNVTDYAQGEWVTRRRFGRALQVPIEGFSVAPISGRGQGTSGSA